MQQQTQRLSRKWRDVEPEQLLLFIYVAPCSYTFNVFFMQASYLDSDGSIGGTGVRVRT